ncbi:7903_t:CDS:2 [Diversispora eburnea]|uniref:7903_t:CDS:1 n=1 Tax=Diversispora eburnea TaxID=1213867 RepID=A0A9N9CDY8_9GLOM|nr:7903_t:CDS:2 [Diversispora eburnea]
MFESNLSFSQIILNSPKLVWHEKYVPLKILNTLHALQINLNYKKSLKDSPISWLQGLFAVIVMSVGGSTTSAILCGKAPHWLASNTTITTYLIIYFLIFYIPFFHRFCNSIPKIILDPILLIADGILRTSSIYSIIDNILFEMNDEPLLKNSWVAILLCGTLSGCGGSIWVSAFQMKSPNWSFTTPSTFLEPTYDMKISFMITLNDRIEFD